MNILSLLIGFSLLDMILWGIFYVIGMIIFFLPFIVSKRKSSKVLLINMILAPTIIGWLCHLIYELTRKED